MESPRPLFSSPQPPPERGGPLGVWDAASIIVGIVVGTVIFKSGPFIFSGCGGPMGAMLAWVVGGVFAFIGAMCYAELATSYPRSGGDYVYLTKAFGPWAGFLFGWAQLTVIMPASLGAMAVVFGEYATNLYDLSERFPGTGLSSQMLYAFGSILVLTVLNMIGVVVGKIAQNLLTILKIAGLIAIIVAGFSNVQSMPQEWPMGEARDWSWGPASLILIMYAFGGWNDAGFVAAEVRDPSRNIPRALFFGLGVITLLYLLVNLAYLFGLGFETASQFDKQLPLLVLKNVFGDNGAKAMSVVVMISALGAVNGLTFVGARVYATLGNDHKLFAWLGCWKPGRGAPLLALAAQALITLALIAAFGMTQGHEFLQQTIDRIVVGVNGFAEVTRLDQIFGQVKLTLGAKVGDAFEQLFAVSAPIFWAFFLMTGLSLFVLREKKPASQRPFSVPLYPILPLLFCNMCCYGFYSSVMFMHGFLHLTPACLLLVAIVLLGLPLYGLSRAFGYHEGAVDE